MSALEDIGLVYAENDARLAARPGAVGVDTDSLTYTTWGYLLSGGPDVNPLLSGRSRYFIFEEMRRSDAAIKSLLLTFKLPLRAAMWSIEATDDPIVTEAVERQLGLGGRESRLDQSWDAQLNQKLLMLDWGAMFEELQWGKDIESWTFDDGSSRDIRPIVRLGPRAPYSITRIQPDRERGGIEWIEQDYQHADKIPGGKLAWYVLDQEGANFWGTSLLRSVFGSWRLKKQLMISAGIGWDRFAAGIPVVRYPAGGGKNNEDKANRIGRDVRTHERAFVTFEGPEADGWSLKIENAGANLPDPTPLLRHYDAQIAMAGLQQFTSLGRTETGSRSVGEVQSEPFYMAAQALAGQIAEQTTKLIVRRFVDVNFGPQFAAPRVSVGKIQGKSIELIASALANLSSAGFFMGYRELQDAVLEMMELPPIPDDAADGGSVVPAEGSGLGLGA